MVCYVVRKIVVLPELVAFYHSHIHCVADELIAVVLVAFCSFCDLFACKRGSDVQVNVALLLHYTDQDAVQVFAFFLDILMLA